MDKTNNFKKRLEEKYANRYTILGEYKNTKTKIEVRYNQCGHESEVMAGSLLYRRTGCKKCSITKTIDSNRLTQKEFEKRVRKVKGDDYIVTGKFKTVNDVIEVKHIPCGTRYEVRGDSILSGAGCIKCLHERYSADYKKTTEEYSKEMKEETDREYILKSEYLGVNEYVEVKHTKCGHRYKVYPYMFKRGRRCPNCNESTGERLVKETLDEKGIEYIIQVNNKQLKGLKHRMSYDFYLPRENILIEYQGIQHYEPVELFGGEEVFQKQLENDRYKRKFAKDKGIKLIEIPYTEDTKEKIVRFINSVT